MFFKQKTSYEMRMSDWSSDVCSSDRILRLAGVGARLVAAIVTQIEALAGLGLDRQDRAPRRLGEARLRLESIKRTREEGESEALAGGRSEEHTSERQSLMRISYAVFCLKKQKEI